MQTYKCMIVEDEPVAAGIIADYIAEIPFLQLTHTCKNALDALSALKETHIDLLFLDIHLPKLKGFDFLKLIDPNIKVIVTSAYAEYSLQGYKYNVIDYLLKPVDFPLFLQAVNKFTTQQSQPNTGLPASTHEYILVHQGKKNIKIGIKDIVYIESQREYCMVVLPGKQFRIKMPLAKLEKSLVQAGFIKIHRSFIVSMNHIVAYSSTIVELDNNSTLPIGRNYRSTAIEILEKGQFPIQDE